MSKARRFYHICDPNLPVARDSGRQRKRIGRVHIFLLLKRGPEFVGACEATISQKHRGNKFMSTGIGVPLNMAKRLANARLSQVYMVHTELVRLDEEEFVRNIIETLTRSESDLWYPPAEFRRENQQSLTQ